MKIYFGQLVQIDFCVDCPILFVKKEKRRKPGNHAGLQAGIFNGHMR